MPCLVLGAGALVDRVVHGQDGGQAERDDDDGVGGRSQHDRRNQQHHSAGDHHEGDAAAEIADDRDVLVGRHRRAHDEGVDEEERRRAQEHRGQLAALEWVQDVESRRGRDQPHGQPGGNHRQRVLAEVEADAHRRLPGHDVLHDGGGALSDQGGAQPTQEEQSHGERRRQGELLVIAAAGDLDRQHLAEHHSTGEDGKGQRVFDDVAEMEVAYAQRDSSDAEDENGFTVDPDLRDAAHDSCSLSPTNKRRGRAATTGVAARPPA